LEHNMACQSCGSLRLASISAKCSDCCCFWYRDDEHQGYAPHHVGVGGGDYVEIQWCLECGQIQESWPVPEPEFLDDDS